MAASLLSGSGVCHRPDEKQTALQGHAEEEGKRGEWQKEGMREREEDKRVVSAWLFIVIRGVTSSGGVYIFQKDEAWDNKGARRGRAVPVHEGMAASRGSLMQSFRDEESFDNTSAPASSIFLLGISVNDVTIERGGTSGWEYMVDSMARMTVHFEAADMRG